MTTAQYLKNLEPPRGRIDLVLDTDAYNEIDDRFAIAYILKSDEKIEVKGIAATRVVFGCSVPVVQLPCAGAFYSAQAFL